MKRVLRIIIALAVLSLFPAVVFADNPVDRESAVFTRADGPLIYYEGDIGESCYDDGGYWFYYVYYPNAGDTLTITYTDGSKETYTANSDNVLISNENGSKRLRPDKEYMIGYDQSRSNPWTVGEHKFELWVFLDEKNDLSGVGCDIPVTIVHKHKWAFKETLKQATCTEDGEILQECSLCGEKRTVVRNATGHDWSDWYTVRLATTQKTGLERRECIICGKQEDRELPILDDPNSSGSPESQVQLVTIPTGQTLIYNGKNQTGIPSGANYTIANNTGTNAGTYTATLVLSDKTNYAWSDGTTVDKTVRFTIKKAANPLDVAARTATIKYSNVKKKAQTLANSKVITTAKKGQGTVTYTKSSGNKKITINKKTGKITVKKGLKKGTYKVKVKVTAAGNGNYAATTKTVTLKIKVK